MRVLVVEDEVKMASLLKRGLEEEGYAVDIADGLTGVWMGTEHAYDAIVLDVMMPDIDGFGVCRKLREAGRWSPVLLEEGREVGGRNGRRLGSVPRRRRAAEARESDDHRASNLG